jgi:uncharacterized protein
MKECIFLLLGGLSGILSGFLGIGGGTLIIPILIYFFGFSQHMAQGTTLATMVPPIGLLAAMKYWQTGNVDIYAAFLISIGFFLGGYWGAGFADVFPDLYLKRIFGGFLFCISLSMIFGK